MGSKRQTELFELIKQEKENISIIFEKWWEGEKLNNAHKASYYHSQMLVRKYKVEKLDLLCHNSGEEYCYYLKICEKRDFLYTIQM